MRQLLVPTCLFITAWAQPANPIFEFTDLAPADNITVLQKTAAVAAPSYALASFSSGAAETTRDVLSRSQVSIPDTDPGAEPAVSSFDEAGFTAAKFDLVVAAPLTPTPRGRPVPHRLVCETLADAAVDHNIPAPFLIRLIGRKAASIRTRSARSAHKGSRSSCRRLLPRCGSPIRSIRSKQCALPRRCCVS